MKFIIKCIDDFKRAAKPRKVSMFLLLVGLLLIPITSIMVVHSLASFDIIISSIKVPNQYVSLNIDIEDPESMSVITGYSIYNPSVFQISNL
jgi:hypothetical protein